MIVRCTVAAACLAIAACVARPAPDTAALPFAAFGTMDNDVAAVNQAAWAFAAPTRTANNPVDAARAAAAIDYLAGALSSNRARCWTLPRHGRAVIGAERSTRW
jgi:hypothetical protein